MGRTYQQVFGVSPGSEVSEARGISYVPCDAVATLLGVLKAHPFFAGGKLGGQGPVTRVDWRTNGVTHEFNRHHAGLAVDIMLNQSIDAEVALGQHLVRLLEARQGVVKWRSLIYQDYTNNPGDGSKLESACWTAGGHYDHIHIDWFAAVGVTRNATITTVPVRRANGAVVDAATAASGLVTNITWPAVADTKDFASDAGLVNGLADLMARHGRGELQKGVLGEGVCKTPLGVIAIDLNGKWKVTIGPWTGVFTFTSAGGVSWAEAGPGNQVQHAGKWTATASGVSWKFNDPGDARTFTVPLPIRLVSTKGGILPTGEFEMKKS